MKNTNSSLRPGRKATLESIDLKIIRLTDSVERTKSKYEADRAELNQAMKKRDEIVKEEIANALRKSSRSMDDVLEFIKSAPKEEQKKIICDLKEKAEARQSEKQEEADGENSPGQPLLTEFFDEEAAREKKEFENEYEIAEMEREFEKWEKRIRTDCYSAGDEYCE